MTTSSSSGIMGRTTNRNAPGEIGVSRGLTWKVVAPMQHHSIPHTTEEATDRPTFNTKSFYLGKVCLRGHDWEGTGKSLRKKRNRTCVECNRLYDRESNKRGRGRRKFAERIALTNKIKLENGCADCGYNDHPAALHFDHLPGTKKELVIARAVATTSLDRLMAEIEKCEVVCANCHAVRTSERDQYGNPRHKRRRAIDGGAK